MNDTPPPKNNSLFCFLINDCVLPWDQLNRPLIQWIIFTLNFCMTVHALMIPIIYRKPSLVWWRILSLLLEYVCFVLCGEMCHFALRENGSFVVAHLQFSHKHHADRCHLLAFLCRGVKKLEKNCEKLLMFVKVGTYFLHKQVYITFCYSNYLILFHYYYYCICSN